MAAWLTALTDFIAAHPHFAYRGGVGVALSEAIPVIGAIVPGTAVDHRNQCPAFRAGVTLWPLLIATLGAIVGDGVFSGSGTDIRRKFSACGR